MGNEEKKIGKPVNWTTVATAAVALVISLVLGPLVWRLVMQAQPEDMKLVGILMVVLLIFAVFVLALIGCVMAFSKMALHFLRQDDADELRKSQELTAQFAKVSQGALKSAGDAQSVQSEIVQAVLEAIAHRTNSVLPSTVDGSYHDATGGDIELG